MRVVTEGLLNRCALSRGGSVVDGARHHYGCMGIAQNDGIALPE